MASRNTSWTYKKIQERNHMNYLDSQLPLCLLYELKAIIASGWHRIKILLLILMLKSRKPVFQ